MMNLTIAFFQADMMAPSKFGTQIQISVYTDHPAHNTHIHFLKYDIYNNRLFSTAHDKTIKIWNLNKNICEGILKNDDLNNYDITGLQYDHKNNTLAVGAKEYVWSGESPHEWTHCIDIWDLNSKKVIQTISGDLEEETLYDATRDKLLHKRRCLAIFDTKPLTLRQIVAISKAAECKKNDTVLDKETFAWLDKGPNLDPVKEIIIKDTKVEPADTTGFTSSLLAAAELLFALK